MGFEGIKVGDRFSLRSGRKVPIYAHDRRHMLPDEVLTITAVSPEYERVTAVINAPGYETKKCNFKAHNWFNQTFKKIKTAEVRAKPPALHWRDLKLGDKIRLVPGRTLEVPGWVAGVGAVPHRVEQRDVLTVTGQPNAATFIVQDQIGQAFTIEHHDIGKFTPVPEKAENMLDPYGVLEPGEVTECCSPPPMIRVGGNYCERVNAAPAVQMPEATMSKENLEFSDLQVGDRLRLKSGKTATLEYFRVDNATVLCVKAVRTNSVVVSGNVPGHEDQEFVVTVTDWFHRFEKLVAPTAKPLDLKAGDKIRLLRGRKAKLGGVEVRPGEILTIMGISGTVGLASVATAHQMQDHEYATVQNPEWFKDFEKVDGKTEMTKKPKATRKIDETFTWDTLEVGDTLEVKPCEVPPRTNFVDRADAHEDLPAGTTAQVTAKTDQQFILQVKNGAKNIRRRCFTINSEELTCWLAKRFTRVGHEEFEEVKKENKFTLADLEVGNAFKVKTGKAPGAPLFPCGQVDLSYNTIVKVVKWSSDGYATLHVVQGGSSALREHEIRLDKEDLDWLTEHFVKVDDYCWGEEDGVPARAPKTHDKKPAVSKMPKTTDDLWIGDRFLVKPGTEPMPFSDDFYLPDDTVVEVVSGNHEWDGEVKFKVTNGNPHLRGRTFDLDDINDIEWLNKHFTQLSTADTTQEDSMRGMTPVFEEKELTTTQKITKTNHKAAGAVRQGLKQAGARMAHRALIAQVEKAFGRKFPRAFFSTPAGKAMLDLGSCYLVMIATEMVPQHPLATRANEVAGLALTAATYDHAVPLIEVATRLIEGAAGIDILGK